jgi:hypothetical protein
VVHHINDDEDPSGLAKRYVDALPSGSRLFLTHVLAGADREEIEGYFAASENVRPATL